ncbi:MAG: hypothetical protein VX776_00195 [Planctomycetota bacterium]|nr:hypothetical protein [Planctomycetota bacterium]
MKIKPSVQAVAILASALSVLAPNAQAQSNSKGVSSAIVVGTLKSVDSSGTQFDVQQSGESLRKLYADSESKIHFVGMPTKVSQKPEPGMGVKASCQKDGRVKAITFTPQVGEPAMLGENRLQMTESELLKAVDKDASNSVSYVEFSKYIYHSPKHGPDSFRKVDSDNNGVLDPAEFTEALGSVAWWKLSRKTPVEWFTQADVNMDTKLDIREFSSICTSGNHLDNIFKRTDRDGSGSLDQRETTAYIRSIVHGKQKIRKKRKREK